MRVKRNAMVLCATLLLLTIFAIAGWWNCAHRRELTLQMQQPPAPSAASETPTSPLVGKPAPAFALENLQGRKVSLADFKGKVVVLNFWATWCVPCKIETPWLVALRSKYASQGVEVLGISAEGDDLKPGDKAGFQRERAAAEKFVRQMKVPYPVLLGGDSLSDSYDGLDSLPTSVYVNRQGVVVAVQTGLTSANEIESNIRKAMEIKTASSF